MNHCKITCYVFKKLKHSFENIFQCERRCLLASSARRTRWLMLRALEGKQDLSLPEVQRLLRAPEELSGEEVQSLAQEIFAPAQKIEVLIAPPESAAGDCRPINL